MRDERTPRNQRNRDLRNAQVRTVDDIVVSLGNGARVPRRRHGPCVDGAGEQRGEHFRCAAGLDHRVIPSRLHVAPFEGLNSKVVRGGADARYTDLFAAQVFQSLNFRFGENALGQMIFDARDKYQIVVATHHRAYEADAAVDQDLRVAAEHCRRRQRRSADVH